MNEAGSGAARWTAVLLAAGLCGVAMIWGMAIGSTVISAGRIVEALMSFDATSREHIVVTTVRLPRVLAGLLAGSALAVAGAIMQAVTNNPLASPGLLGINSGAAFAVVLAIVLGGAHSASGHMWAAFAGAGAAALAVYGLGSFGRGGATPLKLTIAGAVLGSFLGALTTAVLIFDQGTLDQVRLWVAGSLSGRSMAACLAIAPYTLAGLAASLALGRQITTLSLCCKPKTRPPCRASCWRTGPSSPGRWSCSRRPIIPARTAGRPPRCGPRRISPPCCRRSWR